MGAWDQFSAFICLIEMGVEGLQQRRAGQEVQEATGNPWLRRSMGKWLLGQTSHLICCLEFIFSMTQESMCVQTAFCGVHTVGNAMLQEKANQEYKQFLGLVVLKGFDLTSISDGVSILILCAPSAGHAVRLIQSRHHLCEAAAGDSSNILILINLHCRVLFEHLIGFFFSRHQ